jgi:hypothetical protein
VMLKKPHWSPAAQQPLTAATASKSTHYYNECQDGFLLSAIRNVGLVVSHLCVSRYFGCINDEATTNLINRYGYFFRESIRRG